MGRLSFFKVAEPEGGSEATWPLVMHLKSLKVFSIPTADTERQC